jgi:hypothetical protein
MLFCERALAARSAVRDRLDQNLQWLYQGLAASLLGGCRVPGQNRDSEAGVMANNPSPRLVAILRAVSLVLGGAAAAQMSPTLAQQASTGPSTEPQTSAPSPQTGSFYIPESSKTQPGSTAHTNYQLRSANGKKPAGAKAPSEGAFGGPVGVQAPSVGGPGPQ